jgi:hypothetical protein
MAMKNELGRRREGAQRINEIKYGVKNDAKLLVVLKSRSLHRVPFISRHGVSLCNVWVFDRIDRFSLRLIR